MRLLVLPGDGIGPEITAAALPVMRAASERFRLGLEIVEDVVGHESLRRHGTTVRPDVLEAARKADGLVLGPTAALEFKDEINPSMFFRKNLDLFANIRPSRTFPGVKLRAGEFDLVVVRENTEGFYADRNMESGGSEMLVTKDMVISLRRITRFCCERIARAAFELALAPPQACHRRAQGQRTQARRRFVSGRMPQRRQGLSRRRRSTKSSSTP